MRIGGRDFFIWDEAGGVMPVAVLMLGVVLGMGALAIDSTRGFAARDQLQAAADAAALAGASASGNRAGASVVALDFAGKNAPYGAGSILEANDVELGNWDADTKTFTPTGSANFTAVRVTTRMSQAQGNAMQSSLASIMGIDSFDVAASAIATVDGGVQWDINLVQDVSGSFRDEIDLAVTADQTLLQCISERADPSSRIGGVTFGVGSYSMGAMVPLEAGFDALYEEFGDVDVGYGTSSGGTNIGAGLNTAIDMILAVGPASNEGKQGIVLVGDGVPVCSRSMRRAGVCSSTGQLQNQAVAAADRAEAEGISIFTVFFNENSDYGSSTFMESLVRGDGTFSETPDPTQLTALTQDICNSALPLRLVS